MVDAARRHRPGRGVGGDGAHPQRLGAAGPWFRRRGARVVLVPPERSADLPDRGILDFDATGANPAPTACYADAAFVAERFRFIEARREIRT